MAYFEHAGHRVRYEVEGKGIPVLLMGGFSDMIEGHAALRAVLAKRYRVIAADPPGSGRSGPQPRRYTANYFNEDAATFLALLRHLDAAPAHLIGWSDGGEYALLMAVQEPNAAASVFTWGSAGAIEDPQGFLIPAMHSVVDNPIGPLQDYREYLVKSYGEANARAMTQSLAHALDEIVAGGGELALGHADEITCPVMLVTGGSDMFASPQQVERLAGRIAHSEFRVKEDAGHSIQATHPEWLIATATEWLDRQSAGA